MIKVHIVLSWKFSASLITIITHSVYAKPCLWGIALVRLWAKPLFTMRLDLGGQPWATHDLTNAVLSRCPDDHPPRSKGFWNF